MAARGEESFVLDAIWRSQAVISFSMSGEILDANPVFLEIFGYSLEEIKGKHHRILCTPEYATSKEYDELWRQLATGKAFIAELHRVGKHGEVWLQATYSPILTEDGAPFKVIKFATDITEQKRKIADLTSQIDAIRRSQCVVSFTMDGRILDANKIFLDVMGYSLVEVKDNYHTMFVTPEYAASEEYAEFWKRLRAGEFQIAEYKRVGRDGREVWLQATYSPILDAAGKPCKVIKFATDTTEQRRRIAEADRQKAMFLANMSHEIRTPMNGIFGMLSLLKDTQLDSAGRSFVDTCMRSAESLLAVLNDILLYSKADANAIQLESLPFNLNDIVEDVLYVAASSINTGQDVAVTYFIKPEVPLFLVGDGSRLRQILSNLLSNAVKFTKYGEVSLDVSVQKRNPLVLKFDINDTGIGIPEADLPRLFTPFTQIDPTVTRSYGGTGLGLAICKQLVTLLNGEITVHSRPSRGSTFSFTAEFLVDSERPDQSIAAALNITKDVSPLRGLRALIVDLNATNRISIETLLKTFGMTAVSTHRPSDGIDILRIASLRGEPFDFLVVDAVDLESIRGNARINPMPKIVSLASSVDAKFAVEANVLGICTKPVRRGQLLQALAGLCSPSQYSPLSGYEMANNIPSAPLIPKDLSILVVEDNDTNRKVISCLLQQAQIRTIAARNGIEALDLIDDTIDLVLIDVHMPVLDGIQATRLLLKARPQLPVIFISADVTEETKRRCSESGAVCTLIKPVNRSVLFKTIAQVMRNRSSPKQLIAGASRNVVPSFRCLIADDVSTNRMLAAHLIKKVFGPEGVEIHFADSGQAAIKIASEQPLDLALIDVRMPLMSGIDATRVIRQMPHVRSSSLRIIGITGFDDDATIRECTAAGMDSVLVKPLHESHLRSLRFMLSRSPYTTPHPSSPIQSLPAPPEPPAPVFDEALTRELHPTTRSQIISEWLMNTRQQLATRSVLPTSPQGWKEVEEFAHALKSSACQLGALRLGQLTASLERLAKMGNAGVAETRALIDEMERVFIATQTQMERVLSPKRGANDSPVNNNEQQLAPPASKKKRSTDTCDLEW